MVIIQREFDNRDQQVHIYPVNTKNNPDISDNSFAVTLHKHKLLTLDQRLC